MADQLISRYMALPPISRTIAAVSLVSSVCIHTGFLPGYYFFYSDYFMKMMPPQIWRLVTCFLITGPSLGIVFDTYFLYTYLRHLEKDHPRLAKPADLIWYLVWVCGTIQVLSHVSGFHYAVLNRALVMALCYTASQEQRGSRTTYFLFDIPSQTVPYAMLLFNLLLPQGASHVIEQVHGLVAAHLYLFLSQIWPDIAGGRKLTATPAFVARLVDRLGGLGGLGGGLGASPGSGGAARSASNTTGGRNAGPLPDSWRTRGPGQRLG